MCCIYILFFTHLIFRTSCNKYSWCWCILVPLCSFVGEFLIKLYMNLLLCINILLKVYMSYIELHIKKPTNALSTIGGNCWKWIYKLCYVFTKWKVFHVTYLCIYFTLQCEYSVILFCGINLIYLRSFKLNLICWLWLTVRSC